MSPAVAGSQQSTDASPAAKTSEFRLSGDTALWSVAIRPGQTEAFERVMARLQEALKKSADPRRREQADGWTVVRLTEPLTDGSVVYVHMIRPVVPNANYSIMQILDDAFPDERRALYDLYRGAFDRNLSLATGSVALDLSGTGTLASSGASLPTGAR
jgi:hypothetical protein